MSFGMIFLFFNSLNKGIGERMDDVLQKIMKKIISSSMSRHARLDLMEKANNAYFGEEGIKLFQVTDASGVARNPNGGFLDKPRQIFN